MIFSPKLASAVARGKKTQTRRPIKRIPADDRTGATIEAPCRYKVDHDYALQRGRGKPAVAGVRIKITDVRRESVGEISFKDARAEGFKTREDFFAYWRELYGPDADMQQPVWVICFVAVSEERYLAAKVGGGEPTGETGTTDYVHGPAGAVKEGGQVVPEAFQNELTVEARERFAAHREKVEADEQAARQQRRLRQMLKEGVRDLGPVAGQAWLARIERVAREAKDELEEAA